LHPLEEGSDVLVGSDVRLLKKRFCHKSSWLFNLREWMTVHSAVLAASTSRTNVIIASTSRRSCTGCQYMKDKLYWLPVRYGPTDFPNPWSKELRRPSHLAGQETPAFYRMHCYYYYDYYLLT
jgi:hypothetical protein